MVSTDVLSDEERAALEAHGNVAAAARALGIPRETLRSRVRRAGGETARPAVEHPLRDATLPRLTRQALHEALKPPNNCHVKRFAEGLDPASRKVLEEALAYDRRDMPASRVRDWLLSVGFVDADVPGIDAINAHRGGQRPCRCKG